MSIAAYILVPATKALYILTAFGSFGTHGIGSVAISFLLGFGGISKGGFLILSYVRLLQAIRNCSEVKQGRFRHLCSDSLPHGGLGPLLCRKYIRSTGWVIFI